MFVAKVVRELKNKRLQASSFDWVHLWPRAGHEFSHCTPQSSSSPRDTWPEKHQSRKYQDVAKQWKASWFFFRHYNISESIVYFVYFDFKDRELRWVYLFISHGRQSGKKLVTEAWDHTLLFSKAHHPATGTIPVKLNRFSVPVGTPLNTHPHPPTCPPLTCMTSQSQSGRRQTSRCWILRKPSAAGVWPASHTPSAGWRRTGRIRPPSRRSSRTWRSSSAWSPDAGLQSPGRSWRWLAGLSLPSPFKRKEDLDYFALFLCWRNVRRGDGCFELIYSF